MNDIYLNVFTDTNNSNNSSVTDNTTTPEATATGDYHRQLFWPVIEHSYGREVLILIHVITMFISIPGNSLTIFIITNNRVLREEPAYLLICSVSCADFIVSMVAQPLNIYTLASSTRISSAFELVFYFSIWGFCGASAFGVVFITIDRFICIIYPMHYARLLDRRRTFAIIAIQWVCGMAYGCLPLIDIKDSAFPTATASLVTLLTMTLGMALIYVEVYRNIKRLNKAEVTQSHNKKRQHNATFTIALIVLAFFVCWFPYIITNFIISTNQRDNNTPVYGFYYWVLGLGCWNSALNVIIYGFKNSTLKKEARKLLRLKRVESFPKRPTSSIHNTKTAGKDISLVCYNKPHIVKGWKEANNTFMCVPTPRIAFLATVTKTINKAALEEENRHEISSEEEACNYQNKLFSQIEPLQQASGSHHTDERKERKVTGYNSKHTKDVYKIFQVNVAFAEQSQHIQ